VTTRSPLRYERDGAVTILTLDRPEVLNAFDESLTEALNAAIADCAADAAIRAVVITGSGRAFSAGQDLEDRLAMIEKGGDLRLGDELRLRYHPVIATIRTMRKPVVAAVNGVAAGAGFGLAVACDVRVAATSASFRAAWGRVGLVPDAGSAFFLPRLVGWGRALDMVLTGDPVSADEALRIGRNGTTTRRPSLAARPKPSPSPRRDSTHPWRVASRSSSTSKPDCRTAPAARAITLEE